MLNKIQSCLSSQKLEQIGRYEVSPNELLAVEEHLSECENCRAMFDSHYASPQWSEDIRPALSESSFSASTMADDGVDHSSAMLKLLGPTDDPDMLGRIGNYEIVGVIGQGGMGAVFKGFDRSLNRFVAIKMLLPHLAASGAARKRFAREGQAVAAVVDDHVMAIHCVDEWQGIPYLVMTYSRGVSLQKRLNDNGPLEVREILRIGMQAAKGLAAAHAQGIVHRDIKPSNILLDQNVERVQLVDFGLARAIDDASLTCSGTLAGTPQYMSPEQARAETVDHRSDLFSLGSVLYAMCVGHAPYRAESSYGVLRLITDKEPRPIREINSDIPEWLCIIIARLMSKSPSDRYASADDVATILEQCIAHVQDPMQHSLPDAAKELEPKKKAVLPIVSRFQRWFPIMSDKRIVSLLALLLLLLAFLVPWPLATFGKMESAFAFACTAALLSFGLALLSRTEYFSKIVLWGFGITAGLCLLGIVLSVPLYFYRASTHAQMAQKEAQFAEKVASEKMQAALAQEKALADALAEERKRSLEKRIEQEKGDTKKTEQEDSIHRGGVDQNDEAKTRTSNETIRTKATTDTNPIENPLSEEMGTGKRGIVSVGGEVDRLLSEIDFLNRRDSRGGFSTRSMKWGQALMELTRIGAEGVPEIIERLNQTEDDRMIASLAFVLRAIGDRRSVPALIRAIPKTLVSSEANFISQNKGSDGDLELFFQKHKLEGMGPVMGCSTSAIELRGTLAALTDAKLPIPQTFGSGTERQVYLQRQLLHQAAVRLAEWWEQNSKRFVDDIAYAKVSLSPFTTAEPKAVTPIELLNKLSWSMEDQLQAMQSASTASKVGYRTMFLDLDTGRSDTMPPHLKDKELSEQDRIDLLAWCEKEGFDVFCDQIDERNSNLHYVLRGIGLRAWQVEEKLWSEGFESKSWSEIAKEGRVVNGDQLIPFVEEDGKLDPTATGVFLFVTREGNPGLIYLGPEVTPDAERSDKDSADWLHDHHGFVKGRKFRLHFFEENQSQKVQGNAMMDSKLSGNETLAAPEQQVQKEASEETDAKATSLSFPQHMHGDWQIQNATNLTSKQTEFVDQIVTVDENSLLLTTSRNSTRFRLSFWKLRDEDQSIELDLISDSSSGMESKALRCLMKFRDDKLILLQPQNDSSSRPKSEESSSLTRFTMVRELDDPGPKLYTPLEAIEVAKQFANDDHGQAIAVKFRVASVHPPFVSGGDDERGHSKLELHLDFRTLPANFAKDQFLVVLTQEAIVQYQELGIRDIEKHFLDKEIEIKGRVLSATMTARSMPGDHFHLIVNDLRQIVFVEDESQGQ